MDKIFKTKSQRALDEEINRLTELLSLLEPYDEDYPKILDRIKMLAEIREKKDPSAVSTETLLNIGANLIGLLLILNFERSGVITSKAFGWIWKK